MKAALESILEKTIQTYSKDKGFEVPGTFDYGVVVCKDSSHGDFASNVAMQLAKFARQKPSLIAVMKVLSILSTPMKSGFLALSAIKVSVTSTTVLTWH